MNADKDTCKYCGTELTEMRVFGALKRFCINCLLEKMEMEERRKAMEKLKSLSKEESE